MKEMTKARFFDEMNELNLEGGDYLQLLCNFFSSEDCRVFFEFVQTELGLDEDREDDCEDDCED